MSHKVFHMEPAFAQFAGTLFTSGNSELAANLVRTFMASEGSSWGKIKRMKSEARGLTNG